MSRRPTGSAPDNDGGRFALAAPRTRLLPLSMQTRYFDNTGSGGTLSFGASACMVISVIDVIS